MNKFARVLIILPLVVAFTSCERPTQLKVEDGNPPKIVMSGSGDLGNLVIRGPRRFRQSLGPDYSAYWYIRAESGARPIEALSPLSYGTLPKGYKQVYPEQGSAPPLTDEGIYYIHVDTNNAPGASGYFVVREGKFRFVRSEAELTKEDYGNRN